MAALSSFSVLVCSATIVPRLSLQEMTGRSEMIVTGSVIRTWAAWDRQHQFIWTHSEILVHDVAKGARLDKVVVSEPGGVLDGVAMRIAGAPVYSPGEQVMVFLERMPNGALRAAGFGQGKLVITPQGRIHVTHTGAELIGKSRAIESFSGTAVSELWQRVRRIIERREGEQ
jgi:hypothetical protein